MCTNGATTTLGDLLRDHAGATAAIAVAWTLLVYWILCTSSSSQR